MRTALTTALLALATIAHAQAPIVATGIKLTVTSTDQGAIQAIARDFARQGLRLEMSSSTTVDDSGRSTARYSATGTRSEAFTGTQLQAIAAPCAQYAQRGGVSCSSEATQRR